MRNTFIFTWTSLSCLKSELNRLYCLYQDSGVLRIRQLLDENKRIQINLGDSSVSVVSSSVTK